MISGTAARAASVLTVTRTSCEPAWARRATWIAVASASAVSVFVIDWTTTGWAEPRRARRRRRPRRSVAAAAGARRGLIGGRPTWTRRRARAMSKPVTQIRNANRNDEPDEVGQPLGPELIRAPKKRLSTIISIRPPSRGGNGRMLTRARLADRMAGHVERA